MFALILLVVVSVGIVLLGIPLAITLATPARYLKFYLLWLAMLAVLVIAWHGDVYRSSPISQLGEALGAIVLGAFALFVVAKIAIVRAIRAEAADGRNFPGDASGGFEGEFTDEFADEFTLGMAALTGLFAAPWSMFLVALAFSAEPSATLAHDSTSIVLIAASVLLVKSRNVASETVQTFASALFASAIITLVMAAIYVSPHVAS
jgi:hypothetical protein